jgi:hypothetical protein
VTIFARERDDVTIVSWIIENDRKICPALLAMEVCNGFAREIASRDFKRAALP